MQNQCDRQNYSSLLIFKHNTIHFVSTFARRAMGFKPLLLDLLFSTVVGLNTQSAGTRLSIVTK